MGGTWNDLLAEVQTSGSTYDQVRRKYLQEMYALRKRNIIAYYSGWLQKPHLTREPAVNVGIDDADKNGFMSTIHGMDRTKGLDLIIHTPGGEMAATESLVDYLRSMFGKDICAFVPQLAMSGGTMIACACKEIWMGKESSIGPVDPQMGGGLPAQGILEEFNRAAAEIKSDPSRALVWQPILGKLQPSALTQCEDAVKWSKEIVASWLETGMFAARPDPKAEAKRTVDFLTGKDNKAHGRHIAPDTALSYGLEIKRLESDQNLQDAVLTVHHAIMLTLQSTPAYKLIESHEAKAYILMAQQVAIQR